MGEGFAGKILSVDLSERKIVKEPKTCPEKLWKGSYESREKPASTAPYIADTSQ